MTNHTSARGPGFWLSLLVGWSIIAYGFSLALSIRGGVTTAGEIAVWIAGGHLLHDAVVAPTAALVGVALSAAVAPTLRGPVRAGLITTACVLVVAYPALRGFGAKPRNPSVLPLDYDRAVLTVLGIVWIAVAAAVLTAFMQRWSMRHQQARGRRPRRR